MELIINVLTGKRKKQEVVLQPERGDKKTKALPYLLETEAISLKLESKEPYSTVILLMDDSEYLFHESAMNADFFHYKLMPKSIANGHYQSLFFNYFGVANITLKLVTVSGETQFISFGNIEILARKLTTEQATSMIDFILQESGGDLYSCLSATRMTADYNEGGSTPQFVLNKLLKTIKTLENILPSVINRPITRVSSETRMQNGYQVSSIDEQGLAWLNENISVLEETDDSERAHLHYDNTYYLAREIQTPVIIEHTDINENRAIYGFLLELKRIVNKLEVESPAQPKNQVNQHEEGFRSFYSVMGRRLSKANGVEILQLIECKKRISHLIYFFNKYIPVSFPSKGLPVLTQKAKANRFYTTIFRSMVEWYQFNKIDWRGQEMLFSIKSIPKLFEYYTVLKVRADLKLICEINNSPQINSNSIFQASYRETLVELYYEPNYWMVGHNNALGEKYYNTEIRKFEQTTSGKGFKPSSHQDRRRSPDIVIELTPPKGDSLLLVLDAKYSKMKTAYEERLPECIVKYVHGIHGEHGSSPVKAMILISPTQESIATLADMHAPPYGLFDDKPVIPVLGVQGVQLNNESIESGEFTLRHTLENLLNLNSSHKCITQ
ncbi:conserved hypothetical protein [Bathymodiolus platifrons methanotrophic gill symbiont]|uniref:DUF2357 domain-containing protein n=1 Tax=Bathymodiolus platifrons methanotrophic gill symbiont TaxID=113268 RepID=UPI000B4094A1|nr:DUF2357 domain-containing protein [Bathymodiolus platifrons methanotrophic gill symbiont]GAW87544.1 conserved hypothetical protein [Bathymodiolus platifrons methanotrophic gill symbiont]GFO76956.1 hypothetical protein BPLS_P5070 [Bathymodiolus platifrons methanotrophic gill symbiont]